MSNEKIVVFDDGSIESKVMQHEIKNTYDMTVVPVDKYEDLPKWLDEAIKATEGLFTGIIKIFLHFPFEDYVTKDIRTEIMEATRKNPNIRIIPWYEQAPKQGIAIRAINYGIAPTIIENKTNKQEFVKDVEYMEKVGTVYKPEKEKPDTENKKVADEVMDIYKKQRKKRSKLGFI